MLTVVKRKNSQRKTRVVARPKRRQPKKKTLISRRQRRPQNHSGENRRQWGGRVGHAIGSWIGEGVGIGQALYGAISGSGSYNIKSNSLRSGPPLFGRNSGIRVRHREFLTDITGSTSFSLANYYLNPGLEATFPWLSNIAYNFEQYRFHGLVFEFKTTSATAVSSTNTALGTVVMATDYDDLDALFTNKQQMEAYEYSCSTVPCQSVIHGVECSPRETPIPKLWVRTSAYSNLTTVDPRLYDLGNFQIATVGMQAAAVVGELWVSYDVEFFKPKLITPYNGEVDSFHAYGNGATAATLMVAPATISPLSTLGVTLGGLGGATPAYKTLSIPLVGRYLVVANANATTSISNVGIISAVSGATVVQSWGNGMPGGFNSNNTVTAGSGTANAVNMAVVDVTVPGGTIQLSNMVTVVGTCTYDIYITVLPSGFASRRFDNPALRDLEERVNKLEVFDDCKEKSLETHLSQWDETESDTSVNTGAGPANPAKHFRTLRLR